MADITLSRAIEELTTAGQRVSFHPVEPWSFQVRIDGKATWVQTVVDARRDDHDLEEATIYCLRKLGQKMDRLEPRGRVDTPHTEG